MKTDPRSTPQSRRATARAASSRPGGAFRHRPAVPEARTATPSDRRGWSWLSSCSGLVGNELEQRAVGIAERHAGAWPLGAEALDRAGVNRDVAVVEMRDGVADRPIP